MTVWRISGDHRKLQLEPIGEEGALPMYRVVPALIIIGALLLAIPSFITAEGDDGIGDIGFEIRPSNHEHLTAQGFDNPTFAYDGSITSVSGAAVSRYCHVNCTTGFTRQTKWYGFPTGFIPDKLVVRFDAWADFYTVTSAGNAEAEIEVLVEYSLNGGGSWNLLERFFDDARPGSSVAGHDAEVVLSPSQDPSQVQVRASVYAKMKSCPGPMCSWTSANVLGVARLADIRIQTKPPQLTVSPNPVTRGQTVTFTVVGAPGATISNWEFDALTLGVITRTTNTGADTWSGTLVTGGVGMVRVVLQGKTNNLRRSVSITSRSGWLWPPVSPTQVANGSIIVNGTPVTFASPPPPGSGFGIMQISQNYSFGFPSGGINGGPNDSLYYVVSANDTTVYRYQIAPDLENAGSEFRSHQCAGDGFIAGSVILDNVLEHERGTVLGHYKNYVDARDEASENVGIALEQFVARPASDAAFGVAVNSHVAPRRAAIDTATYVEACNQPADTNTACVDLGNINYTPYTDHQCP